MRLFLQRTAFFVILLFCGLLPLEYFYRSTSSNYSQKHDLVQQNRDAEILILGNSHAFYGLNPAHFEQKAYNLANVSQTIYFDKLLFDKYIDEFKSLKYVVLNVEYTSLSQKVNASEDKWRKYFYAAQMDVEVPIVSDYDPRKYSLSLSRRFSKSWQLIHTYLSEGTLVTIDESGWGTGYDFQNRIQDLKSVATNTIAKHEDGSSDFSTNINFIESIIDKCKRRNIQVILVTMPVTSFYAEGVDQKKLASVFESARKLQTSNDNAHYLNLFTDDRFSNADFFDPDHLHDQGAVKCSRIVSEFINEIQMKQ